MFVYCVRNIETGKLVSNLTNPRHKFWEKEGSAVTAVSHYIQRNRNMIDKLKVVKFELIEIED